MQGCQKQQQGYLFHANAVIPHKTSQRAHARLVTTLDLHHTCINMASPNIHATSVTLQSLQALDATFVTLRQSLSKQSPGGKKHLNTSPIHIYTLQHKVLELSGSTK